MTLEEYSYLFEIIGGMIVIVTLILLLIQLRQNTMALKATTMQALQGLRLTTYEMLIDDSMMEAYLKGMSRPSELTPVEKGKFNAFWTMALQQYQHTYFQIREGAYDKTMSEGWWQVLRNNFASPGFREHWEHRKFILTPQFQRFVETEVMSRQPTVSAKD